MGKMIIDLNTKPLPVPGETRWVDSPNTQTFVAVRAQQPARRPSLTYIHRPLSKMPTSSVVQVAPALDKPLPPMPTAENAVPSPDSCPLLADFNEDSLVVSSELPSQEMIEKADVIPVLDAEGNQRSFKSLYMSSTMTQSSGGRRRRRVLIIFVRHFLCGNCQEYLRSLTSSIPSPAALPAGTELVIIGCGSFSLIRMYAEATRCSFPIYSDPSRRLHATLGMACTLNLGRHSPEYVHHSLAVGALKSFVQAMRRVCEGDAFKAGDMRQVGGEFLFEITGARRDRHEDEKDASVRVTWCHRMSNTRDHSEVDVIRMVLGLDSEESTKNLHNSSSRSNHNTNNSGKNKPLPAIAASRGNPHDRNTPRTHRRHSSSPLVVRRWASTIAHAVAPIHHHMRRQSHSHFATRPGRLTVTVDGKFTTEAISGAVVKSEVY